MNRIERLYFSTKAFSITNSPGSLWLPSGKAAFFENLLGFRQHFRAAARHHAVVLMVEFRRPDILEKLARTDEVGQSPTVFVGLARHGRIIDELVFTISPRNSSCGSSLEMKSV